MNSPNRLYERAPVGLCCLDQELRYLQVNSWLADINGVSVNAHIGRTIEEVIPHVASEVRPVMQKVLDTGDPIIGGRITAETPASPGEPRTFEHNYYSVPASHEKIVGVSCVVWDVTARPEMSVRDMEDPSETATAVSRLLSVLDYVVSQSGSVTANPGMFEASMPASGPPRVLLPRDPASRPTPREHAVLMAFLSCGSVSETAARLRISQYTVRNHLKSLFRKFQVSSAVELVCKALGTLGQDLASPLDQAPVDGRDGAIGCA